MRIENMNEDGLDDIISEIERCPLDADREQLRGRLIARLSDVCLKNWFGKEHSQDYKGFCKYWEDGTWGVDSGKTEFGRTEICGTI